ncbi:hypothetical protein GCK32_003767 [Trichostrongylus colubriformis]|uniref:Uncharacterized protein n=1 Tax=Trichostrongylus colubriformis TaxID=6319 RepID=A0AAN8IKK5_TRICO
MDMATGNLTPRRPPEKLKESTNIAPGPPGPTGFAGIPSIPVTDGQPDKKGLMSNLITTPHTAPVYRGLLLRTTRTHKSRQSSVVLLFTKMRTSLLLLVFTCCALASLYRREAKVGERVELYLGNQTHSWCRITTYHTRGTCFPFRNTNSKFFRENGTLVFESVKESDSGMYYALGGAEKPNGESRAGRLALLADAEIVLSVHK